jgi:hypothetical protein
LHIDRLIIVDIDLIQQRGIGGVQERVNRIPFIDINAVLTSAEGANFNLFFDHSIITGICIRNAAKRK